jgi:hypothetical protein
MGLFNFVFFVMNQWSSFWKTIQGTKNLIGHIFFFTPWHEQVHENYYNIWSAKLVEENFSKQFKIPILTI